MMRVTPTLIQELIGKKKLVVDDYSAFITAFHKVRVEHEKQKDGAVGLTATHP